MAEIYGIQGYSERCYFKAYFYKICMWIVDSKFVCVLSLQVNIEKYEKGFSHFIL